MLPTLTRDANWDTDYDGMPDAWEMAHGLNPNSSPDRNSDFDNDGYTNLEEYINETGAWPAPQPISWTGGTGRYALNQNWDTWQPSHFDEVRINSGTATVDAIGQHARVVKIGTNSSASGTLNITGGRLTVAEEVVIGANAAATATLHLSGGTLATPKLSKGAGGTFNFTGGTLHASIVDFDLVNNGGTIAPGLSPGTTVVNGDLDLNGGALEIEIGGKLPGQYDRLDVHGITHLGGTLKVKFIQLNTGPYVPTAGDSFAFLGAYSGTEGSFAAFDLPPLPAGLAWRPGPGDVTMYLNIATVTLAGDYNNDSFVNAADYVVWRNSMETQIPLVNETESPGTVDAADYNAWRANFGAANLGASAQAADLAVPEPGTLLTMQIFAANLSFFCAKNTRRRSPLRGSAQPISPCSH